MGNEHDEAADHESLHHDEDPDGGSYRQCSNVAPEHPGRISFVPVIGSNRSCHAHDKQDIWDIPEKIGLEEEGDEDHRGETGRKPVQTRMHVDEVCSNRDVEREDDLKIENAELDGAGNWKCNSRDRDERNKEKGTIIEEDQLRRPPDVDDVVEKPEKREEKDDDHDGIVDILDIFVIEKGEDREGDERINDDHQASVCGHIGMIGFIHVLYEDRFFRKFLDCIGHEEIEACKGDDEEEEEHKLKRG